MRAAVVAFALLLTGCAHGLVGQLPVVAPHKAATVTVIREWYFVAGGGPLTIELDGHELFAMRTNEHVTFAVPPGEHTIRVRPHGDRRAYFVAESGRAYYFEVRPTLDWAGRVRQFDHRRHGRHHDEGHDADADEGEGEPLMAEVIQRV